MKIAELLNSNDSELISLGIKLLSQTDFLEWMSSNHKDPIYNYCLSRIFYGNDYILRFHSSEFLIEFDDANPIHKINYHILKLKGLIDYASQYENFRNANFSGYRNCKYGCMCLKGN